jgi:N-acetylmuramoyl-L-alanine amidase
MAGWRATDQQGHRPYCTRWLAARDQDLVRGRRKKIGGHATFGFAGAHFAVSKGGEIWQLVDTKDEAHGAGPANPTSIHIENVGFTGDSLTADQVHGNATLLHWAHRIHGVPLNLNFTLTPGGSAPFSLTPLGHGLGYHAQYGGHLHCPGSTIIEQLPQVLDQALKIKAGRAPDLELDTLDRAVALYLPGSWSVTIGGWTGWFHFSAGKKCAWSEDRNGPQHRGTWKVVGGEVQWTYSDDTKGWERLFHAKTPLGPIVKGTATINGNNHGYYEMSKVTSAAGL